MRRRWDTDRRIIAAVFSAVIAGALLLCGCEDEDAKNDSAVKVTDGIISVDASAISGPKADDGAGTIMISAGSVSDENQDEADAQDSDADKNAAEENPEESTEDPDDPDEPDTGEAETTPEPAETSSAFSAENAVPGAVEQVSLNGGWLYSDFSKINSGCAVLYRAAGNRRGVVIGVNAGHGTKGGQSVKTYCHPDMTPKVTGGSTSAGSITATAVSGGMAFADGTSEASVTLKTATMLRDRLLAEGYDVLMLRDGTDVQLDNVARTVIANNTCACHVALHWDGDGLGYDKGCFYISTPDGLKGMEPVASHWQQHEALGGALIAGLQEKGCKIYKNGKMAIDLTQTSYSTIPSVDIELGNQASAHDDASLALLADGLCSGIKKMF